jgi:hypothetical protein
MPSPLTSQHPARKDENRADIARVVVALGLLALLASFDDAKDKDLIAASPPAQIDAAQP